MANDIVLSSALRTNLLSLQSTQKSIDVTQLRLATGKKVNSALDNPQSFFTGQSLSNRASDLTRLLDGIGQSIRTIEEADKGVKALTTLITQAQSIVSSARDELAASDGEARIVGNVDLRNVADLTAAPFGTNIQAADVISISTTDDAGTRISQNITIQGGDTGYSLAAKITDAFADSHDGEITASINKNTGYLEIQSKGGRTFKIGDAAAGTAVGAAGYNALGIGKYFEAEARGATTLASATIVGGNTVSTISLYEGAGNLVDAGDVIVGSTLTNAAGTTVVGGVVAADSFTIGVSNGSTIINSTFALTGGTQTWQDLVDSVNQNTAINQLVRANFNSNTGSIELTSLADTVENVSFGFTATTTTSTLNLGWGTESGTLDSLTMTAAGSYQSVLAFNSSTQALDQYSKDYNSVREQINTLVKDASYRGVNMLNGDNLTTFFNEDNSSKLVSEGAVFTSDGLGMVVANFTSAESVEKLSDITTSALNKVRSFGSSLSNNLSIIQARQTFTQETINTLKAGAADLVNADPNEEGANLLSLQTRQQLGVTSLSLASQSQQSVLRLF